MLYATARCARYQLENRSTLSSKVDLLFSEDDVVMVTDFLTSGSSSQDVAMFVAIPPSMILAPQKIRSQNPS